MSCMQAASVEGAHLESLVASHQDVCANGDAAPAPDYTSSASLNARTHTCKLQATQL